MRLGFALLLLFFSLLSVSAQPTDGAIRGTVLAEDGTPVANAHVSADVMRGETIQTILDASTDANGMFVFPHLAMGDYRLSAQKQESGYLSTRPDIFDSRPPLLVSLTLDSPTVNTTIRFSPKGAVITGWVRDDATGASIQAHLSLAPFPAGRGWSTTGTSGQFEFELLIPADTDVRFGACSEGYKPWIYADPSNPSRAIALKLQSGQRKKIDIKLEKSSDPQYSTCNYTKF